MNHLPWLFTNRTRSGKSRYVIGGVPTREWCGSGAQWPQPLALALSQLMLLSADAEPPIQISITTRSLFAARIDPAALSRGVLGRPPPLMPSRSTTGRRHGTETGLTAILVTGSVRSRSPTHSLPVCKTSVTTWLACHWFASH